ncbi:MAG: high frequency lysogenization protein HflD [Chromatocurvus sp.]
MSELEQQTLALAGVAQAARLVDQLSRTGSYPAQFLQASIHSLFRFEVEDAAAVFGGAAGVKLGLDTLASLLGNRQSPEQRDINRYLFALLHLERRFAADTEMMGVVHSRLQHASFKAEHFSDNVSEVCHSIAGIYGDTLSQLRFRIKVTGSAQHLQDRQTADKVRALLLAGIRAAFLWRQLGGRRWKLVLQRRRQLAACQTLSRGLGVV